MPTSDAPARKPNIVFIFADEWRAQATGYNGDPNCITPQLDQLADQSVNVSRAVSGHPVCCPYRASLMTGQYPLTHGVFINDVELDPACRSIADVFSAGGYRTGYIGKWHLYGSPEGRCERRRQRVPREYQLRFDDWWGYECCHDYWNSPYWYNDDPTERVWEGYDLHAQSRHAADYIRSHAGDDEPFLLMLSWGPPHFPLHTAPEPYRQLYADRPIELRPNVPERHREQAVEESRGYYAHIAALDDGLAMVLDAIDQADIAENTILVVTSDHGEMTWSQGLPTKHMPFDESLRVPFLLRWPGGLREAPRQCPIPLDAPDILPTLAGLTGVAVPDTVEGRDWSPWLRGQREITGGESAFLQVPAAYTRLLRRGIPPYRGVRTRDITYVRTTDGPWLLLDNAADPCQMHNLIDDPACGELRIEMEAKLQEWMDRLGDEFDTGPEYLQRAGLDHYREANNELIEQWTWPWGG